MQLEKTKSEIKYIAHVCVCVYIFTTYFEQKKKTNKQPYSISKNNNKHHMI